MTTEMDGFHRSTHHPMREQHGAQGFQQQSGGADKLITTFTDKSMNLTAAVSSLRIHGEAWKSRITLTWLLKRWTDCMGCLGME
ncbi:MAG: hypothetical protein L0Y39_08610 [Methylococcaceae bacterium]|nr:hypothetical protein [Methylococcaceae bacterium]